MTKVSGLQFPNRTVLCVYMPRHEHCNACTETRNQGSLKQITYENYTGTSPNGSCKISLFYINNRSLSPGWDSLVRVYAIA